MGQLYTNESGLVGGPTIVSPGKVPILASDDLGTPTTVPVPTRGMGTGNWVMVGGIVVVAGILLYLFLRRR